MLPANVLKLTADDDVEGKFMSMREGKGMRIEIVTKLKYTMVRYIVKFSHA